MSATYVLDTFTSLDGNAAGQVGWLLGRLLGRGLR